MISPAPGNIPAFTNLLDQLKTCLLLRFCELIRVIRLRFHMFDSNAKQIRIDPAIPVGVVKAITKTSLINKTPLWPGNRAISPGCILLLYTLHHGPFLSNHIMSARLSVRISEEVADVLC